MIRILFFIALSGAISLLLLSSTGSDAFHSWTTAFIIATVVFKLLDIFLRIRQSSKTERNQILQGKANGRVQAALILDRRQTGMFINEQPQVEFRLLVDRPGQHPFLAKTKEIVSLIDTHLIVPGNLLTVVHPNPEYGDVHVIDEPTPSPSRWLTADAATKAPVLPNNPKGSNAKGFQLSTVASCVAAILVGAVGAPYLAAPNAHEYVPYIFSGDNQEIKTLDYALLFEPEALQTSFDVLSAELEHEEIFSVVIHDVSLSAEAPAQPRNDAVEEVTVKNHEVTSREPALISRDEETPTFTLSEVNWGAVLDSVPEAQQLVADRGSAADVPLSRIRAERDDSNLAALEVWLYFDTQQESEIVRLDTQGELLPSEMVGQLSEEEQAGYLFDAERAGQAMQEMRDATEAEYATKVLNYGHWTSMDAYVANADGTGTSREVQYRDGQLDDVADAQAVKFDAEEIFALNDVDWELLLDKIPAAQQELDSLGMSNAAVQYIIVEKSTASARQSSALVARMYFHDEFQDSGFVEFDMNGAVLRSVGP